MDPAVAESPEFEEPELEEPQPANPRAIVPATARATTTEDLRLLADDD